MATTSKRRACGWAASVHNVYGGVTREKDPDRRDNVYGGAVNIPSRISGLSASGEVLVSETVRSLARTSAGVSFEDRGEQAPRWSASRRKMRQRIHSMLATLDVIRRCLRIRQTH